MTNLPDFLTSIGKSDIRPGGSVASGKLIELINIRAGQHALVMGPGASATALFISMTTQATTEALVATESESVTRNDPSLERRSTSRVGKPERMPFDDDHFDHAMIEGVLYLLPPEGQRIVLREVMRVVKPGGRVGIHEFCWRQPPNRDVRDVLNDVFGTEVYPHVVRGWWDLLENAGQTNIESDVSTVSWFTRKGIENDEAENALDMFYNALEDGDHCDRFVRAFRTFAEYRPWFGSALVAGTVQ